MYAPSQWEQTLLCNVVSHWLGAYTNDPWSRIKIYMYIICCIIQSSIKMYFYIINISCPSWFVEKHAFIELMCIVYPILPTYWILTNNTHHISGFSANWLPNITFSSTEDKSCNTCASRPVAQIPQCTSPVSYNAQFCNWNVHVRTFLLQKGVLWDSCLMHSGICEMALFYWFWWHQMTS